MSVLGSWLIPSNSEKSEYVGQLVNCKSEYVGQLVNYSYLTCRGAATSSVSRAAGLRPHTLVA